MICKISFFLWDIGNTFVPVSSVFFLTEFELGHVFGKVHSDFGLYPFCTGVNQTYFCLKWFFCFAEAMWTSQ